MESPAKARLPLHRGKRSLRHVVTEISADCHATWPVGMPELSVATLCRYQAPALPLKQSNHFPDFHTSSIRKLTTASTTLIF